MVLLYIILINLLAGTSPFNIANKLSVQCLGLLHDKLDVSYRTHALPLAIEYLDNSLIVYSRPRMKMTAA